MAGDITVYLENGTYRLTSTLTLTPLESGTNGHNVVWTAAPGAHPVLDGGDRITGWKLADASKDIWSATVPGNLRTRQLYVNGTRATMASGVAPVALTKTSSGYTAPSPVMAHWRNPSNIDFVFTGQVGRMTESVCPVASIRGAIITMAQPCWNNSTRRVADHVGYASVYVPSYIENAYALLSEPGQFYLDTFARTLYYIPRKGENLQTADVEAPVLQTLVKGSGTPSNPIGNLVFSNIALSYSTWLQPGSPQGFSEVQAGYTLTGKNAYATEGLCRLVPHGTCPYGAWTKEPASVLFAYNRNVSFLNDRFVHLGAAGLNLDDGSQQDTITQSVFTDISGNGIEVGNVDRPQAKGAVRTLGVTVTDNHLYSLPVEFHGGVAILVGYAASSLISHNQIDHVAYTAISIGWGGWLDKVGQPSVPNFSHDNVISDNVILDFMQVVEDGGGVYTQGTTGTSLANGEKVTGNVVHGMLDWGAALKSDDGAAFITYSQNVLYDNGYDWCCDSVNYSGRITFHPQIVQNNFWEQALPNTSKTMLMASGNTVLTGAQSLPAAIVNNAGIDPSSKFILGWKPAGILRPDPPQEVAALYAANRQACVTWHPSIAAGTVPALSYTVGACLLTRSKGQVCGGGGAPSVTVSATAFAELGYAIVPGLKNGDTYGFTVTANGSVGSSTASIASPGITVGHTRPAVPSAPIHARDQPGPRAAALWWCSPASADCGTVSVVRNIASWCPEPVLAYVITSNHGGNHTISGLSQLIETNHGGRDLVVIAALKLGLAYRSQSRRSHRPESVRRPLFRGSGQLSSYRTWAGMSSPLRWRSWWLAG